MSLHVIASQKSNQRTTPPRLTIGIPTWNRSARLAQQLQAIAPLLTDDVEVLVCDNGSSDNTWALLGQLVEANMYSLRCVHNPINLGADVNYLRVIEAAAGQWLWFVGDDDPIDFQVTSFLLAHLSDIEVDLLLLLDISEVLHPQTRGLQVISPDAFFRTENDLLGQQLFQVGRVVCRVEPAKIHLRDAHRSGIGDLHAYAFVYAPLLLDAGLVIAHVRLLRRQEDISGTPRWDLLKGHIGAWKTTLSVFKRYGALASARERRSRTKALLLSVMMALTNKRPLLRPDLKWMLAAFDNRGRLVLISILAAFALNRRIALWLLSRMSPVVAMRVCAAPQAHESGY